MDTKPQVVIFDVNETLTDMTPLRTTFEEVGLPGRDMDLWFAGILRDGIALAAAGGFAEFAHIGKDLLRGMGLEDKQIDHVLGAFTEVKLHPDVPDGMRALRAAGIRLFTMTNGAAAMTRGILGRAGLLDLVEETLDVSGPGVWKPARAAYDYAVGRAGVRPGEAALVAVHPWDIDGAERAGLVGAYLDRRGVPYPETASAPRVTALDLRELAGRWR
ncbi:2-haloacid dehalogenase [Nonomuraea maritima]|uniref:2-haloacid dehalogenase n=1 Tax=Nonomuraea maritima TaxID=683260 RepID=A0A1G8UDB2_9ACTN|nr:haloacid dehalogenase type II [Nonomuraea maritima]SDJ50980.1 2-haloacid dehalogenase [Nonomuraea maritima]